MKPVIHIFLKNQTNEKIISTKYQINNFTLIRVRILVLSLDQTPDYQSHFPGNQRIKSIKKKKKKLKKKKKKKKKKN